MTADRPYGSYPSTDSAATPMSGGASHPPSFDRPVRGNGSAENDLLLNDTYRIIENGFLTVRGQVSLVNSSTLVLRNSTLIMDPEPGNSSSVKVGAGSSLLLENSTLTGNASASPYNLTCGGFLALTDSRMDSFGQYSLLNCSAEMRSSVVRSLDSNVYIMYMVNSQLDIYNSTLDLDNAHISPSSRIREWEYLNIRVSSWYMGRIELAIASVRNVTGETVATERSGPQGRVPPITLSTASWKGENRINNGPFEVNVTHPKYHGNDTHVEMMGDTYLDLSLDPVLGHIEGTVSLADGIAVEGATVSNSVVSVMTDGNGVYRLDVFGGTTYTMSATKRNNSVDHRPGTYVSGGNTLHLDFTLSEDPAPFSVDFLAASVYRIPMAGPYGITFDPVLDAATVNSTSIRLEEKGPGRRGAIRQNVELGGNGRTVTLTLKEELAPASRYLLIVTDLLRTKDGNTPLWRDFRYDFKTDYVPVTSNIPHHGETNVSRGSTVVMELSVPFQMGTLDETSFMLLDPAGRRVNGVIGSTGNTIVFRSNNSLHYGSVYRVSITPTLSDSDGQVIFPNGYSWTFSTQELPVRPTLRLEIIPEGGLTKYADSDPILEVTGGEFDVNFTVGIPSDGIVIISNLSSGNYSMAVRASGYGTAWIRISLAPEGSHNHTMAVKRQVPKNDGHEDGGVTDTDTLLIIGIIMTLFLIGSVFMGIRMRGKGTGRTKDDVQRSSAPGMDSFEFKVTSDISPVSKDRAGNAETGECERGTQGNRHGKEASGRNDRNN